MTPHPRSTRSTRSFRSILLGALSLLTACSGGCVTGLGREVIQGEPPLGTPLHEDTPLEAVGVRAVDEGYTLTLRLRLEEGAAVEHVCALDGRDAKLPVLVQFDTYAPAVGAPAHRVDAAGHLDPARTPLTKDEVTTHLFVVLPPGGRGANVFSPRNGRSPAGRVPHARTVRQAAPAWLPYGGVRRAHARAGRDRRGDLSAPAALGAVGLRVSEPQDVNRSNVREAPGAGEEAHT